MDYEASLIAGDLTAHELTSIADLDFSPELQDDLAPAVESFNVSLSGADESGKEEKPKLPPCYCSYQKFNGHVLVRIMLMETIQPYLDRFVALLDSVGENDQVEIIIATEQYGNYEPVGPFRNLLSAMERCQAHITTIAGTIYSIPRLAIWLSGDKIEISPFGWIRISQTVTAVQGEVIDVERAVNNARAAWESFKEFIVKSGLFTMEQMDSIYSREEGAILSIDGDVLLSKVAELNALKQSR